MPDVVWFGGRTSTFSDGTAGTPGIRFTDDTDTGFFRSASNELRLSLGGTEEYRWTTATLYLGNAALYFGSTLGATDGVVLQQSGNNLLQTLFSGVNEYQFGTATLYLAANDLNFGAINNTGTGVFRASGNNILMPAGQLLIGGTDAGFVNSGTSQLRLSNGSTGRGGLLLSYVEAGTVGNNSAGWYAVATDTGLYSVGTLRLNAGNGTGAGNGWQVQSAAPQNLVPGNDNAKDLGTTSLRPRNIYTSSAISLGGGTVPTSDASTYLTIQGVSGAGGTPTSTHLTSGDADIAVYAQQAHDGVATKFVIAYNSFNGLNYLSIPMDGSSTAWTHNQTRP